jgi:hypothetical protein
MPRAFRDLTGQSFGKLTVLAFVGYTNAGRTPRWKCRCSCNEITIVSGRHLLAGHTKSCGCFRRERFGEIRQNRVCKAVAR